MISYLKSETLKLKHSSALYVLIAVSLTELLIIPPYLFFIQDSRVLDMIVYLPMLAYCVLLAILSILMAEQESQANDFQYLKSDRHKAAFWSAKLLVLDMLLLFPSIVLWTLAELAKGRSGFYLFVGLATWMLLVFLNHFHALLALKVGRASNILLAFIECLFIIFATNKVFLSSFWLPIALPVNAIMQQGSATGQLSLLVLAGWIVLVWLMNIVFVKYK